MPTDERLKVLGLSPVWRLRTRPEATPESIPALAPVNLETKTQLPPVVSAHSNASSLNWDELRQKVLSCTRCSLHETRTRAVFGVGDIHADWLIIGEAPGAEEDRQGEPFVGQAGKLLDAMLASIGLKRGDNLYIANVLKSRPPGNRDPKADEVAACIPYLERQIDLIQPKIIVALGRIAAQNLLRTEVSISRLRGEVHQYRGVPMVVTYHPAYLLRNPADKTKVWDDLCMAKNLIESGKN
jgi:DNA polymerase